MTDEIELEAVPKGEPVDGEDAPEYEWLLENDAALRCFITKHYSNPEIDAHILIRGMSDIFDWIKTGKVPRKTSLRVVGKPEEK